MPSGKRILVTDDEPNLRRVLGAILEREGHEVLLATNGQEALQQLLKHEIHTVITDLRMPGMDGMELLRRIVTDHPDIPVIILTAHGSVDNAVAAVKLGAFDYLEKPFEREQIKQVIDKALRTFERRSAQVRLPGAPKGKGRYGLVGTSAAMQTVFNIIEKVADTPSTVLICGESGTGKELIAKAIHEQSPRREKPLIKVNCAAIPETLIESELFGYEKGAFTGAVTSKPGRFELADQGTLFLDEIGEIPAEMQVKLLRVLQENEFERVGGIKTIKVDVRLVTATNRNLLKAIEEGRFREDLYYRLNVVPINMPPLRERRSDIPYLISHILEKFEDRLKKGVTQVSPEALDALMAYHWPGNIRELENMLERTVLFCEQSTIRLGDLPEHFRETPNDEEAEEPEETPSMTLQHDANAATIASPAKDASLKEIVKAETERVERNLIVQALDETAGNVTHAAKKLKISRKSLQTKMKELGLREHPGANDSGKVTNEDSPL